MATPSPSPYTFSGEALRSHADSEWVLTNALGGFAMGTAWGTPRRRYHALLTAALSPPVGRVCTLQAMAEALTIEHSAAAGGTVERRDITDFRFAGWEKPFAPPPCSFERAPDACRWTYAPFGPESGTRLTKNVWLADASNAVEIDYSVTPGRRRAWLELRPLVSLRDFHATIREHEDPTRFRVEQIAPDHIAVSAHGMSLNVRVGGHARFSAEHVWWKNVEYARDIARGQEGVEDLFCPGVFLVECPAESASKLVTVSAWIGEAPGESDAGAGRRAARIAAGVKYALARMQPKKDLRPLAAAMVAAADQFIVKRLRPGHTLADPGVLRDHRATLTSIIAGYPWFGDWGRDTFISLPGLLLCTGRHAEALDVLAAFAGRSLDGLIPNCFDDASGAALYNTADASLWYIVAACAYVRQSADRAGFMEKACDACLNVVDAYRRGVGTIRVDHDALIVAGDATTQLTWMDARRDGVVFTPRHGKPVEINALWHAALHLLADAISEERRERAGELRVLAERAGRSFAEQFWNESKGCLHDVLTPTGDGGFTPIADIRPNQVFAVSLPHSPLSREQRRRVLAVVRDVLLTPRGLRTLDPSHPAYEPRFEGPLFARDRAYHNGTVWPWLIGPYAEAVLRVGDFSAMAKVEARSAIASLLGELTAPAPGSPIGSIAEIYDADETPDAPRRAEGCPAQAWSIAELFRVLILANTADTRE